MYIIVGIEKHYMSAVGIYLTLLGNSSCVGWQYHQIEHVD
jgi:hypothetical protein